MLIATFMPDTIMGYPSGIVTMGFAVLLILVSCIRMTFSCIRMERRSNDLKKMIDHLQASRLKEAQEIRNRYADDKEFQGWAVTLWDRHCPEMAI
jgi:uncharacterized membrane protein